MGQRIRRVTTRRGATTLRVVSVLHREVLPKIWQCRELFATKIAGNSTIDARYRDALVHGDFAHHFGDSRFVYQLLVLVENAHVGEEFLAQVTSDRFLAGIRHVDFELLR